MKLLNMNYEAFLSPLCVDHTVHVTEASNKMFYTANLSNDLAEVFSYGIRLQVVPEPHFEYYSCTDVLGEKGGRCETERNMILTGPRREGVRSNRAKR